MGREQGAARQRGRRSAQSQGRSRLRVGICGTGEEQGSTRRARARGADAGARGPRERAAARPPARAGREFVPCSTTAVGARLTGGARGGLSGESHVPIPTASARLARKKRKREGGGDPRGTAGGMHAAREAVVEACGFVGVAEVDGVRFREGGGPSTRASLHESSTGSLAAERLVALAAMAAPEAKLRAPAPAPLRDSRLTRSRPPARVCASGSRPRPVRVAARRTS